MCEQEIREERVNKEMSGRRFMPNLTMETTSFGLMNARMATITFVRKQQKQKHWI